LPVVAAACRVSSTHTHTKRSKTALAATRHTSSQSSNPREKLERHWPMRGCHTHKAKVHAKVPVAFAETVAKRDCLQVKTSLISSDLLPCTSDERGCSSEAYLPCKFVPIHSIRSAFILSSSSATFCCAVICIAWTTFVVSSFSFVFTLFMTL